LGPGYGLSFLSIDGLSPSDGPELGVHCPCSI
jgi:hypothetical protein